jgi:hypothetical protein
MLELFACLDISFETDEYGIRAGYGDAGHVYSILLHRMHECTKVLRRRSVVARQGGEAP